jgi:hypothetical protein
LPLEHNSNKEGVQNWHMNLRGISIFHFSFSPLVLHILLSCVITPRHILPLAPIPSTVDPTPVAELPAFRRPNGLSGMPPPPTYATRSPMLVCPHLLPLLCSSSHASLKWVTTSSSLELTLHRHLSCSNRHGISDSCSKINQRCTKL